MEDGWMTDFPKTIRYQEIPSLEGCHVMAISIASLLVPYGLGATIADFLPSFVASSLCNRSFLPLHGLPD